MNKLAALLIASLVACSSDDEPPPVDDHATAPTADLADIAECTPAADYACPPWWLSCSRLQLRQSECRTACTTGGTVCAGYDAGECFTDCVAYRYEAYCPAP